ncbi:type II secretion system protein GspK [Pseudoalteromonas sp. 2CM41L]|jgi:general secretion pathway protein K|uniref:general secretion pathway protein GspK n=1 Tax=unclassified Pseudoalteromonas TaxID=194690 RepID=UPI0020C075B1|nr:MULTISPECIES: type II secretion system protein GspK [unclassified Pseudoalteromonas]MCK8107720.1 type II secretion system protein GspK [Pseudoalteromonas sp. 2CM41L]MCK8117530.1 type II secretion system protein GspK [Pseudoalteromonas sp. 2CM37A]
MFLQRGIALIQVLIIAMILSILGIYILQSSKDQVAITDAIKIALDQRIEIENAESKILHTLLSEFRIKNLQSENEIVRQWNFHNKPFTLDNVSVQIQDLNGLISLNEVNKSTLDDFFVQYGVDKNLSEQFIASLTDWIDKDDNIKYNGAERAYYEKMGLTGPRNGLLQSVEEVFYIKNHDILPEEDWYKYFTVANVNGFNPAHSPEQILKSFIKNDTKVAKLIELRNNKQLNGHVFYNETGIDSDEFLSFLTGDNLRITLTAKNQQQKTTKTFTVKLRARSLTRPVVITNVVWN